MKGKDTRQPRDIAKAVFGGLKTHTRDAIELHGIWRKIAIREKPHGPSLCSTFSDTCKAKARNVDYW